MSVSKPGRRLVERNEALYLLLSSIPSRVVRWLSTRSVKFQLSTLTRLAAFVNRYACATRLGVFRAGTPKERSRDHRCMSLEQLANVIQSI